MFVLGKPFQQSVTFAKKAMMLECTEEACSGKHSSLLVWNGSYEGKKFYYIIDIRGLQYKTVCGHN